jgi:hypothetical protein
MGFTATGAHPKAGCEHMFAVSEDRLETELHAHSRWIVAGQSFAE